MDEHSCSLDSLCTSSLGHNGYLLVHLSGERPQQITPARLVACVVDGLKLAVESGREWVLIIVDAREYHGVPWNNDMLDEYQASVASYPEVIPIKGLLTVAPEPVYFSLSRMVDAAVYPAQFPLETYHSMAAALNRAYEIVPGSVDTRGSVG